MQVRHMCSAHFLVETCQTELALGHLLRHISRMKLGYRWGEIQVCESEIISLGLSVVMNYYSVFTEHRLSDALGILFGLYSLSILLLLLSRVCRQHGQALADWA